MEEFLFLMKNFKMSLKDSGTLYANANIQYFCTILRGEALHQFDTLCAEAGSTTKTHLNRVILDLVTSFFLLMHYQNKSTRCSAE